MSLPAALDFIRAARERTDLAERVRALGRDATVQALTRIGAGAGYSFTPDEFRAAHRHEWTMRWLRYGAAAAPTGAAAGGAD